MEFGIIPLRAKGYLKPARLSFTEEKIMSFREMKHANQQLSNEEAIAILQRGKSGLLALHGDNGYPYAETISYVNNDGNIILLGAPAGHKHELLARDNHVSFCVVDLNDIVPQEFTTYFRSAIVFGTVRTVTDPAEKQAALEAVGHKYAPNKICLLPYIGKHFDYVKVMVLEIDHLTAKESIELVRAKTTHS